MTDRTGMTEVERSSHQNSAPPSSLIQRFQEAGISLLECDNAGETTAKTSDWLGRMCCASRFFCGALAHAVVRWSGATQSVLDPCEVFAGLWLIPLPVTSRRRRAGLLVAVKATASFVDSEQFVAMCQSGAPGGTDLELSRTMVLKSCASTSRDIQQLAAMVRGAHADDLRLQTDAEAVDSLGKQLAESYEEMHLLYTITQNMTVQEPPERFIARACRELLSTLPFAWIGLQLADDPVRLKGLSGRLITAVSDETNAVFATAGDSSHTLARALLGTVNYRLPVVLEPGLNPAHSEFAPLGRSLLVHPVMARASGVGSVNAGSQHNVLLGILIAGGKTGSDPAVSSIDIKLCGATATHMAIFLENAALYDDLNAMFMGTLEALTASIDAKDRYTCGHSRRVAHLTQLLAQAVGMDGETVGRCRIAGLVHDVGKIGVPEAVLLKPGKLDDQEFAWIRKHPEIGHRILKDIPQLNDVLPGVLHHHERWDGRGYPHNISGLDIPLVARLISLADSFDAMSSTRTYRSALSRPQVLAEIVKCAGVQFDPDLAKVFVTLDFTEYDRMAQEHQATDRPMEKAA